MPRIGRDIKDVTNFLSSAHVGVTAESGKLMAVDIIIVKEWQRKISQKAQWTQIEETRIVK